MSIAVDLLVFVFVRKIKNNTKIILQCIVVYCYAVTNKKKRKRDRRNTSCSFPILNVILMEIPWWGQIVLPILGYINS